MEAIRRPAAQVFCLAAIPLAGLLALASPAQAQAPAKKPNILVIFGDDVGQSNISAYTRGLMGYQTPNIDRIANEGLMFTDYYAEQSCTAGRSTFITGQMTVRTGLSKVGIPGATVGLDEHHPHALPDTRPTGDAGAKPAVGAPKHQPRSPVYVANALGVLALSTVREDELCVPSSEGPNGS